MCGSQVLCSTSTLALGVNLPAHLVVVKSTRRWSADDNEVAGYKEYDTATCLQMIGRCVQSPLCKYVKTADVAQPTCHLVQDQCLISENMRQMHWLLVRIPNAFYAGRVVRSSIPKAWRSS